MKERERQGEREREEVVYRVESVRECIDGIVDEPSEDVRYVQANRKQSTMYCNRNENKKEK